MFAAKVFKDLAEHFISFVMSMFLVPIGLLHLDAFDPRFHPGLVVIAHCGCTFFNCVIGMTKAGSVDALNRPSDQQPRKRPWLINLYALLRIAESQ